MLVNGQTANMYTMYTRDSLTAAAGIGYTWRSLPLDRSVLVQENVVEFRIGGALHSHWSLWLRVNVAQAGGDSACAFSGHDFQAADLGPQEANQGGKYMVHIAGEGAPASGNDPTSRGEPITLRLVRPERWKTLTDVYSCQTLTPVEGQVVRVGIPPQSGLAYLAIR